VILENEVKMSLENKSQLDENINLKKDFAAPDFDEWKNLVIAELKGADFQKKMFTKTYEGITLKPIYTRTDLENNPFINEFPGMVNYVRGRSSDGYLSNSWLISQETKISDPQKFNEALKSQLEKGQNTIHFSIDSYNYKESNPRINSEEDFENAFRGIDLTKYPLLVNCGESNFPMFILLKEYAAKNNIDMKKLTGGVLVSPFSELLKNGLIHKSTDEVFDEISQVIFWCKKNDINLRTIAIDSVILNNSGATAVQELAFVLASGVEFINNLLDRNADINLIAKNILVSFGVGSNYFLEIAKFRAARFLWSKLLEVFNANEESSKLFIHARTTKSNQTIYDPHVNILRTTTEAFSAIVGGVDSLHTNRFDEIFSDENEFAGRIARNTQIILKEEAHLDKVIDPAGGSYFVESLTKEIAEAAWKEFQLIQSKGGLLECIKSGYIQDSVSTVAEQKSKDVKTRKQVIVGSNMYANPKESRELIAETKIAANQKPTKNISKKNRENLIAKIQLMSKKEIIEHGEIFKDGLTIEEFVSASDKSSGQELKIKTLSNFRPAELFEELRMQSEKYKKKNGTKPKVYLINMGSARQFKTRADFSRAFFETGGFDVIYNNGFTEAAEAAEKFHQSGSSIAVICSTDENYPSVVPSVLSAIGDKKNLMIILAGYPKDQIDLLKQAGIDDFIFLGCNAYDLMKKIYSFIEKEF
jgi:methylmalonyl-CoA mutase